MRGSVSASIWAAKRGGKYPLWYHPQGEGCHKIETFANSSRSRRALVALGGNAPSHAGPPAATLRAALARLAGPNLRIVAVSRFWRTPAFPAGAGPDFVNAATVLETGLEPDALLDRLHATEAQFGRVRDVRWGARTLDLDLIALGDLVRPDSPTFARWRDLPLARQGIETPDRVVLPHPRVQDRAFVLVPLAEVAACWRHPVLGVSVAEMLAALPAGLRAEPEPL